MSFCDAIRFHEQLMKRDQENGQQLKTDRRKSYIFGQQKVQKRESDKPVTRRYLYFWICLGLNSHDVTDISFIVIIHKKKKQPIFLSPHLCFFCSNNYSCFKIKPLRQLQRKYVLIIIFIITKVKKSYNLSSQYFHQIFSPISIYKDIP